MTWVLGHRALGQLPRVLSPAGLSHASVETERENADNKKVSTELAVS
jgi:hypothetical protein